MHPCDAGRPGSGIGPACIPIPYEVKRIQYGIGAGTYTCPLGTGSLALASPFTLFPNSSSVQPYRFEYLSTIFSMIR
jgi:hypothetical protein